jgi:hypothetical protein
MASPKPNRSDARSRSGCRRRVLNQERPPGVRQHAGRPNRDNRLASRLVEAARSVAPAWPSVPPEERHRHARYEPHWRADGGEMYYLSTNQKLMAVAVGPGPTFGKSITSATARDANTGVRTRATVINMFPSSSR